MKTKGTYLVPTLLATEYIMGKIGAYPPAIQEKAKAAAAARSEMFRNAVQLGVKIAFGTDARRLPARRECEGVCADDAARDGAAGCFALGERRWRRICSGFRAIAGTLEKGKAADIIAMPGDPVADITATERVFFVMRDGKIVKHEK